MRTIKFRAKSVYTEEWEYGNFIHSERFEGCSNEFRIHNQAIGWESDVLPETVGQFTGLTDKNGVEIYEGDILKSERQLPIYNMFEENESGGEIVMVNHIVKWYQNSAEFSLSPICYTELMNESLCLCHLQEIVGNIHDNPEMLF